MIWDGCLINNFNTNKVTKMNSMFQECNELQYLDLSNFNTSNVNDMGWMFYNCYNLKYLNLLNFSLKNDCIIKNIFYSINHNKCNFITNNNNLKNIYY